MRKALFCVKVPHSAEGSEDELLDEKEYLIPLRGPKLDSATV